MKQNRKTRRQFLKGMGGAALAIPFLPSVFPQAWAQSSPVVKRFVALYVGHGQLVDQWLPDRTRFAFTQRGDWAREASLAQISGNISPILGTPFNSLRSKINLISRLDATVPDHAHKAEFVLMGGTRAGSANSLDQIIARKLTGRAPLTLRTLSNTTGDSHVSVANGQYVQGQINPAAVFSSLFQTSGTTSPTADNSGVQRDIATVDLVLEEYKALRTSRRISKEDRERLDAHVQMVYEVEQDLKTSASSTPSPLSPSCQNASGPSSSPANLNSAANYSTLLDQMFAVLEMGIKCGQVRVASMMLHSFQQFEGSLGIPGIPSERNFHDEIGHGTTEAYRPYKLILQQFYAAKVARFLERLNVVEDPLTGRTYLDNSLIYMGNEHGTSARGGHHFKNYPVLLAGSAGGFLRTGQFIDYGPNYSGSRVNQNVGGNESFYLRGRPYNQLLVTIAQAMGLSPADYEVGGTQGFGIYGSNTNLYDIIQVGNHRREILPLLKA